MTGLDFHILPSAYKRARETSRIRPQYCLSGSVHLAGIRGLMTPTLSSEVTGSGLLASRQGKELASEAFAGLPPAG